MLGFQGILEFDTYPDDKQPRAYFAHNNILTYNDIYIYIYIYMNNYVYVYILYIVCKHTVEKNQKGISPGMPR